MVRKSSKNVSILLCGILIVVMSAGLLSGCGRTDESLLEKLKSITKPGYEGRELPRRTIEELKEGIARYEKEADRKVEAYGKVGIYYKILAIKYIEAEMYGLALESLEEAINIYPENAILFYLAGMSMARTAKSEMNQVEQKEMFQKAERYYRRALEIDSDYVDVLYGLSVLYIFELNRIVEAEPLLEKILEKDTQNVDALFLLARVYIVTGRIEDAVDLYDRIIKTASSPEKKRKAQENKETVLEGAYEF